MKAYLYESNGVVKAYPRKAPEYAHYIDIIAGEIIDSVKADIKYDKALKEWSASGKIIENILIDDSGKPWMIHPDDEDGVPLDFPTKITPGQQVETEPSGDRVIVTKIL